ncbi:MAG TPA: hypothetical protein PLO65_17195, partial [Caulobacter sp.]|nr:hypothetical protein [Caulobacter sp.]
MTTRSILNGGVAGLAALAMIAGAAAIPTAASAQGYAPSGAYEGGYRYDGCQRERTTRGTGGALVGAGLGAL